MTFPKPKTKPIKGIEFEPTREGFRNALSRRESSSNLKLSHDHKINLAAQIDINFIGFVGYFQFGENALIDCGYYNPRIKNSDKSSKNNWIGTWTGKDGITSLEKFKNSPRVQIKAFEIWVDILCNRMRNKNINEFYGKTINNVEITESGCIAAAHLKGTQAVLDYLTSNGKINGKDALGTGVAEYIALLAYYDLETCCKRKIYISVEKDGKPVPNINVGIETVYLSGSYYSKVGTTQNTYTTNKEGKILVIVRHPGAVIKVTVNGKSSTIIQKAGNTQNYTIDITGSIKATGALEKPDTPKPRPVPDKSPQDVRNEQSSKPQAPPPSSSTELKEVTFNITIVEGDTKKPITNLRYYLIYKSKPKDHRTDNQGVESNITAEVGQDIEVCVAGNGKLQAVAHFKVDSSHQGKTIRALLPVQAFNIEIKDQNKAPVKNTKFIIFYRGQEIVKQTNSQGLIGVKMLVGFVYKLGLVGGKPLATLRCIKGAQTQTININEAAKNKAQGVSRPTTTTTKNPSSPPKPENNPPPTKPTATKPKPSPVTEESHTEKNGRPITTVVTDKAASDTTRYHIYHNGKIKRQNADAKGHAEFIYYDENGGKHNLGKSAYKPGQRWKSKGNKDGDNEVYLIDIRKFLSYSKDKVKYKMIKNSEGNFRYFLSGLALAAYLGTLCKLGYNDISFNGFSTSNGDPGESSSHINGLVGDMRYLRKDFKALPVTVFQDIYSHERSLALVNTLYEFGFGRTKNMLTEKYNKPELNLKNYELPHCSHFKTQLKNGKWVRHHDHLHIQGFKPNLEDI